jgi:hypothetical protein
MGVRLGKGVKRGSEGKYPRVSHSRRKIRQLSKQGYSQKIKRKLLVYLLLFQASRFANGWLCKLIAVSPHCFAGVPFVAAGCSAKHIPGYTERAKFILLISSHRVF